MHRVVCPEGHCSTIRPGNPLEVRCAQYAEAHPGEACPILKDECAVCIQIARCISEVAAGTVTDGWSA